MPTPLYFVELEPGVYLAPGNEGDPSRTLVPYAAEAFDTEDEAKAALQKARQFRPFINAEIQTAHSG